MKNLILSALFLFTMTTAFGQPFKKGNFISTHIFTVTLQPGVTLEQYKEFYSSKVIPEFERHTPDLKGYMLSGLRGENKSSLGVLWFFGNEKERNKYFNDDGTATETGKAVFQKLQPVLDELNKLGSHTAKYTDWLVQ